MIKYAKRVFAISFMLLSLYACMRFYYYYQMKWMFSEGINDGTLLSNASRVLHEKKHIGEKAEDVFRFVTAGDALETNPGGNINGYYAFCPKMSGKTSTIGVEVRFDEHKSCVGIYMTIATYAKSSSPGIPYVFLIDKYLYGHFWQNR